MWLWSFVVFRLRLRESHKHLNNVGTDFSRAQRAGCGDADDVTELKVSARQEVLTVTHTAWWDETKPPEDSYWCLNVQPAQTSQSRSAFFCVTAILQPNWTKTGRTENRYWKMKRCQLTKYISWTKQSMMGHHRRRIVGKGKRTNILTFKSSLLFIHPPHNVTSLKYHLIISWIPLIV